jgi:hypothetical protein
LIISGIHLDDEHVNKFMNNKNAVFIPGFLSLQRRVINGRIDMPF